MTEGYESLIALFQKRLAGAKAQRDAAATDSGFCIMNAKVDVWEQVIAAMGDASTRKDEGQSGTVVASPSEIPDNKAEILRLINAYNGEALYCVLERFFVRPAPQTESPEDKRSEEMRAAWKEALSFSNHETEEIAGLYLPDKPKNTSWNKAIHTCYRVVQSQARQREEMASTKPVVGEVQCKLCGFCITGHHPLCKVAPDMPMVSLAKCSTAAEAEYQKWDVFDSHDIAKAILESAKEQGVKVDVTE